MFGEGSLWNIGQGPVRLLGEACAGVCKGKSSAKGIADDDFLQRVPLVTTPYLRHSYHSIRLD